jgi:hypothetical protein
MAGSNKSAISILLTTTTSKITTTLLRKEGSAIKPITANGAISGTSEKNSLEETNPHNKNPNEGTSIIASIFLATFESVRRWYTPKNTRGQIQSKIAKNVFEILNKLYSEVYAPGAAPIANQFKYEYP